MNILTARFNLCLITIFCYEFNLSKVNKKLEYPENLIFQFRRIVYNSMVSLESPTVTVARLSHSPLP